MNDEIFFIVNESPDGGYEARAVGYSIFTQADTEKDLKEMVREAVECHFDNTNERPKLIHLRTIKDELISA